ncbi:exodeoxyribonuclease V subunit beta [Endozoicomonas sp. SCSIO W0465]|uniref:exodeoxyribonuclease V subunit beta n=1 Tax=Endozoicomonas sp. SCSIO W0465 TaxID=2918516 RepID=UPI002074C897|nr:exodeoxyribonuclease V subunit beta [Endozoicomonas sp. SCSIO W0465]USE39051.1 exodeoxyribonuclease V subunit beta [Endozoicomonas sp. SCSIO W0465]
MSRTIATDQTDQTRLIPETLDPHALPLHGVRLIEASAGTGKTYTIANLYLRILLGHGSNKTQHETPLTVDQILVVTFTEAATGELRDRIRARIHQTRDAFIEGQSSDPFIQRLIRDMKQPAQCQALLLAAEQQMDEAAIFTIHGFCQRMLKQHAFESGTLFSSELITDTEPMLQLSAADYWRRNFYPLEKPLVKLLRNLWKTPNDLLGHLRSWLPLSDLKLAGDQVPESMDDFRTIYLAPARELKLLWQNDQDRITDLLRSCGLRKDRKPLKRLGDMTRFLASDDLIPNLDKDSWEIYGTEILQKSLLKTGKLPKHPIFRKIDEFLNLPLSLKEALQGLITRDALHHIKSQLTQLKTSRYQLSFDDLLTNLANALFAEDNAGELLAQAIRGQYRIAMIDEFQDTDPLQYRIFNKIYMEGGDPGVGLFMIGDPKQAIYAFRGADIFTYMQARQQVHSHYTLDTNWRSSDAMVSAVNTVFQHSATPFIYNDSIPFEPVHPSPGASQKRLYHEGAALPAMTLWLQKPNDGPTINAESYLDTMSQATATEINRLLSAADRGNCQIHNKERQTPLQPGDIAVLVRSGRHGQKIRKALAAQNIASIYLSNQDSVFTSREASDLEKILQACLHPTSERVLKAALATSLFHLDALALDALNVDEQAWESAVEEFTHYGELWRSKGILPMLRQLIFHRKIAEQLLSFQDGERRLTDLLHLGELLAAASLEQQGAPALTRWFSEQIIRPNHNANDQQLHLESERNLVKIITIHKSKGLEYKVVFIPFPCHLRKADSPLYHDPKTSETWLALTPSAEASALSEKERLAEDLRLLYVALTRSVYCCYLGMAPYKSGRASKEGKTDLHQTAIGYLLNQGSDIVSQDLSVLLEQMAGRCDHQQIVISAPPADTLPPYIPVDSQEPSLSARNFTGNIERNWWTTSYSALSRFSSHRSGSSADAGNEAPGFDTDAINEQHNARDNQQAEADPLSLFNFPKGAQPGTFMHSLFEELDMNALRSAEGDAYLNNFLVDSHARAGYGEEWLPATKGMLLTCLNAPLDGDNLRLINLPDSARRVEMEFYLPIEQLNPQSLNQLIAQHDPLSARAGELQFHRMKGMLKGFIDLTFEYQGRWYVLDYKSNWLGNNIIDYSRETMEKVMIEHRYDLQYQLYSLALHRLLRQRVPDYDYDQHVGGVIYLFLRGVQMDDPEQHGVFSHRPSFELINGLDQLFRGEDVISETKSGKDNEIANEKEELMKC